MTEMNNEQTGNSEEAREEPLQFRHRLEVEADRVDYNLHLSTACGYDAEYQTEKAVAQAAILIRAAFGIVQASDEVPF